jgi:hypothetical protein
LTVIDDWCFARCFLKSIEIPSSVEVIGSKCFIDSRLEIIVLQRGSRLRRLGPNFSKSGQFRGIAISSEGDDIAWNDSGLTVRDTPACLEAVARSHGWPWFYHFSLLESVVIPPEVEAIRSMDFYFCTLLTELTFAPGSRLKEIFGFQKCTKLAIVAIPQSVERIGASGFADCVSLKEIVLDPQNALRMIVGFKECPEIERIENPPRFWMLSRVFIEHGCESLSRVRRTFHNMFQPPLNKGGQQTPGSRAPCPW